MADPILDKTKQGLAAFIRSVLSRTDFLAMYPCQIVSQNSDSTLELKPDDARLPPYSNVPLRLGIPGCTVTVASGSRALVGWYAGDPSKPFAALFESSTVIKLNVSANTISLNSGSSGVGRVGDAVSSSAAFVTWLGVVGAFCSAGVAPASIGAISAGSTTVKAG